MQKTRTTRDIWNRLKLVVLAPLIVVFLIVFVPLYFIVFVPLYFGYRLLLRVVVELTSVARGRRILVVYSRSPLWQPYVESNWLPRLGEQAVLLNWSDRREWQHSKTLEARVFRHWAYRRDFNPMVLLFSGLIRTRRIGLYSAFHDLKHGKPDKLQAAESELFAFAEGKRKPRA